MFPLVCLTPAVPVQGILPSPARVVCEADLECHRGVSIQQPIQHMNGMGQGPSCCRDSSSQAPSNPFMLIDALQCSFKAFVTKHTGNVLSPGSWLLRHRLARLCGGRHGSTAASDWIVLLIRAPLSSQRIRPWERDFFSLSFQYDVFKLPYICNSDCAVCILESWCRFTPCSARIM